MSRAYILCKRKLKGSSSTKRAELRRIMKIEKVIDERFGVSVDDWKEKHFIYFIREFCDDMAPTTREDYRRTIDKVLECLGKHHWKVKLIKIYNSIYR